MKETEHFLFPRRAIHRHHVAPGPRFTHNTACGIYQCTCDRGFSQMSFVRTKEPHRIRRRRILFFKLIKAKTTCARVGYTS